MIHYVALAARMVCAVCKANYYQPKTSGSTCTACQSGTFNNGYARGIDDTASCRTCSTRQTKTTDSTDGYQQCTCTTPFTASSAGQPCLCPAGYYLSSNTTCNKCAAGYYSSVTEAANCTSCTGFGQVVNAAQTACTCKTNYVPVNATACGGWVVGWCHTPSTSVCRLPTFKPRVGSVHWVHEHFAVQVLHTAQRSLPWGVVVFVCVSLLHQPLNCAPHSSQAAACKHRACYCCCLLWLLQGVHQVTS